MLRTRDSMKKKRPFLGPVSPVRLVFCCVFDARRCCDRWAGNRPPVAKVLPTIAPLGKRESLRLANETFAAVLHVAVELGMAGVNSTHRRMEPADLVHKKIISKRTADLAQT